MNRRGSEKKERKKRTKIIGALIGSTFTICSFMGFTVFRPFSLLDIKDVISRFADEKIFITDKYANSIIVDIQCASLFAKDVNGNYMGILYEEIEKDKNMECTLVNEKETYDGKNKDGVFYFSNIIPGIYELRFSSGRYVEYIAEVNVQDDSQIKKSVRTQSLIEGTYEEYEVFFDNYKNMEYKIEDYKGQEKQGETIFSTDSEGGLYFKVDWTKNININIFVDSERLPVPFEKQFNYKHFVN